MKSLGPAWIIAVAIIGSLLATHREASGSSKWNLELVADSSTPIAGLNRFQAPATSGGNIAFLARDANGAKVIYTLIGDSINRLADTNPSATDVTTWIDLEDPSISENYLAFWGRKGGGDFGIYSNVSGPIKWIVQSDRWGGFSEIDPHPVMSGPYTAFMATQNQVKTIVMSVFEGGSHIGPGGQNYMAIVKTGQMAPGGGIFQDLKTPCVYYGQMAYWGRTDSSQGIYANLMGGISVADTSTPIPMGNGSFTGFSNPSLHMGNVAFKGIGVGGQQGIYFRATWLQGNVVAIADTNNRAPDGTGHFTEFIAYSIFGSDVAFHARSERGEGIYVNVGGLSKIVSKGDVLNGKTVLSVSMGREAVAGGYDKAESIAFAVGFSDGSSAIYRAEFQGLIEDEFTPSRPCKIQRTMEPQKGMHPSRWTWKMEGDCSILQAFDPMGIMIPEKWYPVWSGMNSSQELDEKDLARLLERMPEQEREGLVRRARFLAEFVDKVERAAAKKK